MPWSCAACETVSPSSTAVSMDSSSLTLCFRSLFGLTLREADTELECFCVEKGTSLARHHSHKSQTWEVVKWCYSYAIWYKQLSLADSEERSKFSQPDCIGKKSTHLRSQLYSVVAMCAFNNWLFMPILNLKNGHQHSNNYFVDKQCTFHTRNDIMHVYVTLKVHSLVQENNLICQQHSYSLLCKQCTFVPQQKQYGDTYSTY